MYDKLGNDRRGHKVGAVRKRLAVAMHLQAIEANPLLPEEVAMVEMFEREGGPPEDRRTFILRKFQAREDIAAAE